MYPTRNMSINNYPDYRLLMAFDEECLRVLWQEGLLASGRILKSLQVISNGQRLDTTTSDLADIISCVESLDVQHVVLSRNMRRFRSLCEGLGRTSNLLSLTRQRCRLCDGAVRMLTIGLRNHRSMKALKFEGNLIGDAGISAIVENWPEDSKLKSLDLSYNSITFVGLERLMTALPTRRAMKTLILRGNSIGFEEVEMIGNQLPNLRLREIVIDQVSMDVQVARIRAMQSLLRGIKANCFLQLLDMTCRRVPRLELGHEITFYTKLNKYGRHLLSIANDVPPTLWCLIFAEARIEREFSLSIIFYFLVEQPHLVNAHKIRKRRTKHRAIRRSARLRV